jgi:glycerol-3-phosphate dehydrogenase
MKTLGTTAANLGNTALNAARRAEELAALADGLVVDVLVIGGGVTGVGAALDAASRGLSVALIEAHDLAFGTSRFSSKLVHGACGIWPTGSSASPMRVRSNGAS